MQGQQKNRTLNPRQKSENDIGYPKPMCDWNASIYQRKKHLIGHEVRWSLNSRKKIS